MATTAHPIDASIKIPGFNKPVQLNTIVRLQGFGNYTWLYRDALKPLLVAKSLNWFEQLLPDFVRVHKSDLINPSFVQTIDSLNARTLELSLYNRQIIKVSRRRIEPVTTKLKQHRHFSPN
ncbi:MULTISPECIES: LytTR family DNA-binding domain-containing protein [Spirosoma]|uniref:LytTR family transcriptional regulator n=1 Tax=Spirosoma liriopis TaxID=2937440 RepID=A0ABT0HRF6_9BACT|nr:MULTISPECIES: LytTR family DNA-binding domain-containing protein [Spirosoma]MCK8494759.1 LytTR family transcriptional regulator [Spirosoma liriopis]UHG93790.1 LytTR family transcriptional regulator [Spirosoma oryzicola]